MRKSQIVVQYPAIYSTYLVRQRFFFLFFFLFPLSLYAFPPKGALGYGAESGRVAVL